MNETLFESMNLSPELAKAVEDMNYTAATSIQAGAIPLLLQGVDVIGRSSTGTGKTAAFGIPAVELVDGENKKAQVLVVSPTRELAMQIAGEMRKYAKYKPGVAVTAVYGGASMDTQIRQLRTSNIVIGTPGRILDHLRRRTLRLDSLKMVILDEADEMLNMGFLEDIQNILDQTPEQRQTVLFSATMPQAILNITKSFLRDPQTVDIRTGQRTISTTEQYFYQVPQSRKMEAINLLLQYHDPRRSVIFCNTKAMVDTLTTYLVEHNFKAAGIHGDLKQTARTQVMQAFRSGKARILVATDVAARGIDVENIDTVYNFDIPQEFEFYIHRIGRTGRAGKTGSSHTLVCNWRQMNTIKELRRFINANIQEKALPSFDDVFKKRQDKFSLKISRELEAGGYENFSDQLEELAEQQNVDIKDIACVLAQIIYSKDKKIIPNVKSPTPNRDRAHRGGKRVMVRFDVGRREGIAPNFIVGAIVDSTGLAPRSVGKINIFEGHTLVELAEGDAQTVLSEMKQTKIRGQEVHLSLSNETPHRNNARFGERPHRFRDRSSYRDGGSKTSHRSSKTHSRRKSHEN